MANLAKLEFSALDVTGNNYMSWVIDVKMHLESMGLTEMIKDGNTTSKQNKAKAMIFLRIHLAKSLKYEYLIVKDPKSLWGNLKGRYDNQKEVTLPNCHDRWNNLRFQDFVAIHDYNSEMFKIELS